MKINKSAQFLYVYILKIFYTTKLYSLYIELLQENCQIIVSCTRSLLVECIFMDKNNRP